MTDRNCKLQDLFFIYTKVIFLFYTGNCLRNVYAYKFLCNLNLEWILEYFSTNTSFLKIAMGKLEKSIRNLKTASQSIPREAPFKRSPLPIFFLFWYRFFQTSNELLTLSQNVTGFPTQEKLSLSGRAHDPAFLGGERLRPQRGAVRADIQAGEQVACEIRRVRRVRGRIQICLISEQLHVSRGLNTCDSSSAHLTGPVRD